MLKTFHHWTTQCWTKAKKQSTDGVIPKPKMWNLLLWNCNVTHLVGKNLYDQEPWCSGYGRRLVLWRPWVRIPAPYTEWTFFHIRLLVENCIDVCLKKNEKVAGDGPHFRKYILHRDMLIINTFLCNYVSPFALSFK